MSFAGHVIDMINRQKANNALKQKRKDRFEKVKESQCASSEKLFAIEKKNLSQEELIQIKERQQNIRKKELKKEVIFTLIVVLIFGTFLIYLVNSFLF